MSSTRALGYLTLALTIGLTGVACSGDAPTQQPQATTADGASADASSGKGQQDREPLSLFEPDVPDTGLFCSFLVAAECDGAEDCGEGQVCCGMFNGGAYKYDSMRCQDTCDSAAGGFVICHEDAMCDVEGEICRRSTVLPEFMAICSTESPFVPTEMHQPSTASNEINCGRDVVCGEGEKCCVMASWDASTQTNVPAPGVCVGMDEPCDCADVTRREYEE